MKYRTFGRTGFEVSEISLGGAYLMGRDPERVRENACQVVQRAFELGINYIDTAPLYGNSEELLGHALKGETRPFYLATKVGFDPEDFDYRRDTVLWSLERSLKRLGLPRLAVGMSSTSTSSSRRSSDAANASRRVSVWPNVRLSASSPRWAPRSSASSESGAMRSCSRNASRVASSIPEPISA